MNEPHECPPIELKEKSLDDCMQLGINPNGNAPGYLPDVSRDEAIRWAGESVKILESFSQA